MKTGQKWSLLPLLIGGSVFLKTGMAEGAFLPPHHWSHDALERLATAGLVEISRLSPRPLDRYQAARAVVAAVEKIRNEEVKDVPGSGILEEFILRLAGELNPEIERIAPGMFGSRGKESTWYRPSIRMVKSFDYGSFRRDQVYSLPNGQGREFYDGRNLKVSLPLHFSPGEILSLAAEPLLYDSEAETEYLIQQAYLNLTYRAFGVTAGRFPLWYGPGYHGSLLLSDNHRPPLSAEIRNKKPLLLPFFLKYLGAVNGSMFLCRLEKDRDVSRPYLTGVRGEYYPFPWLGLGATHTVIFGGEEEGGLNFSDWYEAITADKAGKDIDRDDHLGSIDVQFILPRGWQKYFLLSQGLKIYAEIGAEDNLPGFMRFRDYAYLGGVYFPGFLRLAAADLRLEFCRTGFDWYDHTIYTTGYTYRGDVIGNHLGGDGRDYFLQFAYWFSGNIRLKLMYDREERFRSQSPKEIKDEVSLELSHELRDKIELRYGYSYLQIDNSRAAGNQDNRIHLFSLGGAYRF